MGSGLRFSFLVDGSIAGRMDRVIGKNGGRIIVKKSVPEGIGYEVEKK